MSLLEIIQLVGYGTGSALTLWIGALLLKWRRGLGGVERMLLALAVTLGLWHTSNFVLVLHTLLGLEKTKWTGLLRATDSVAVISIVLAYSFLLHLHLHLWAKARGRPLTVTETARVYLSYIPALFLFKSIPHLWSGEYMPMLDKLAQLQLLSSLPINFVQAFMLWAIYVLVFISVTDLIIAKMSSEPGEKRFMQTLAGSFLLIATLIFAVFVIGPLRDTVFEPYLTTFANLGSLLPTALLAHRIYRQRYMDLVIRESLVVATFAALVLIVYLFGIRAIGAWSSRRYGVHSGVIEAFLILALALAARPIRKWLERRFHRLFEREAKLYRDVVARIGSHKGQFQDLSELLKFIEERTAKDLGLRRVRLIELDADSPTADGNGSTNGDALADLIPEVLARLDANECQPLEDSPKLKQSGYTIAYPLRREDRVFGLMLVDAPGDALTADMRGVLEVMSGQVALAIQDHRLIDENVRLELRLEQDARFAALGQMAATVAHEVKNPLSAIKSIAQVLHEDRNLKEYQRDLSLIVGETDRLNNSVTQLLSFARNSPQTMGPAKIDELVQSVVDLFRAEAQRYGVVLTSNVNTSIEVKGTTASAIRDALSNLLLNAFQATPSGGEVHINVTSDSNEILVTVTDTGTGIVADVRDRIWEPFFTTRQRGTGLGLAIVRKRIEEVGGTTTLAGSGAGEGTRFELRVPIGVEP